MKSTAESIRTPKPNEVPLPCFDEARKIVRSLGTVDPVLVQAILKVVQITCKRVGIGEDCHTFGSVGSGLSTAQSDVDLVIEGCADSNTDQRDKKEVSSRALTKLLPQLMEDGFLVIEKVLTSRVPVLKLLAPTNIEVDICYNNMGARRNTLLIGRYIKLDSENIGGLVRLVKQWAKVKGVCGATRGHLSSYAWTLAAIFFLQVEYGMANLQENAHIEEWPGNPLISAGLEKIFRHFFVFYADIFKWGEEAISIRCGRRVRWTEDELKDTFRQWMRPVLDIEDPYDWCHGNNKRRNLSVVLMKESDIDQVRNAIDEAANTVTLADIMRADKAFEQRCEKCNTPEILEAGGGRWCKACWRQYYEEDDEAQKEQKPIKHSQQQQPHQYAKKPTLEQYPNQKPQPTKTHGLPPPRHHRPERRLLKEEGDYVMHNNGIAPSRSKGLTAKHDVNHFNQMNGWPQKTQSSLPDDLFANANIRPPVSPLPLAVPFQ